jgi:hypothetical protein
MDIRQGIIDTANAIGMPPHDLATIISFESGFNPNVWGGAGGNHYGLIQFGPAERAAYNVRVGDPSSQLGPSGAIARYFIDRGYKPGMNLMNAYSIVNAGSPNRFSASDEGAGGTRGDVRNKVTTQFGPHAAKATALLGGQYTPSFSSGAAQVARTTDTGLELGGGVTVLPPIYDDSFDSPMADDLAASVARRKEAGGVKKPMRSKEPVLPTFDFASAVPEAPAPIPPKSLADLFKVADIGGAGEQPPLPTIDYGAQRLPLRRARRDYG